VAVVLAGCAQSLVRPETESRAVRLPRPPQILVYELATSRDEIHPDQGTLRQAANRVQLPPTAANPASHEAAAAFADALVARLRALGLPAERATRQTPIGRHDLLVVGAFVDEHQSQRLGRLVVGFGAGGSQLDTEVDVLQSSGHGRWRIAQFATHVAADGASTDVTDLAFRSADQAAHDLARVFAREGWS
jgi:hypothetical protein